MKTTWPVESNKEKGTKLILFLFSPFIALLYSLKSMNTKSSFAVFFGFAICFGMAFSTESYKSLSSTASGIDAGRYRQEFEQGAKMTTSQFVDTWNQYRGLDEGEKDFYFIAMVYLVSRFTDNYHWLFMAFAIVFAYFQLKALRLLVEQKNWENSLFFILLALFFTWNQIFNINAMRFYTAAWIGVYAVLQIFQNERPWYFLLLLITPIIHSTFWLFDVIVLIAFLLRWFEWMWIALFVASFFTSTILVDILGMTADYLPEFLSKTVSGYTLEERLFSESTYSGTGFWWVQLVFDRAYKIYTNLLVVLFIFNRKLIKEKGMRSLYIFIIIFMTYINFAMPIPALGRRSIVMAYPIIAYLWLANFGKIKYQWLIYAFPFVWAWQIMTYFNFYNSVLDFTFYISSPIILVIKYLLLA